MNTQRIVDLMNSDPFYGPLISQNDIDAIITRLNEKNIRNESHEHHTATSILLLLGPVVTAHALGGLKAAGQANPLFDAVYTRVSTVGIDLANDVTQTTIDQLTAGGAWTAEVGTALKAIGVWYTSQADASGGDATKEDVEAAIVRYNTGIRLGDARRRCERLLSGVVAGDLTTIEQMTANFAE